MMKLSMWSSYYVELSPEDAMMELRKNGYEYCELSDEHAAMLLKRGDAKTVGAEFKKFCDGIGMKVTQGHLLLAVKLCDETKPVVQTLCNWMDLFLAIGIKSAVLHCDGMYESDIPIEEKMEKNVPVLKQLTDYLKGTDMVICLENLRTPSCTPPFFSNTAESLIWFIEQVNSDNLGICLDTGHLNIAGDPPDQAAFIRRAGKYLKALHIADNEGTSDQHMLPFGRGNVNIVKVVKTLKEIGYDGLFNYEVPGERVCPMEIKAHKLQYAKAVFEYLIKNA